MIFAFAFGLWQGSLGKAFGQSSAVSFVTEDGWKLTGSLYLPKQTSNDPIPGVVLLSEPGWEDRSIFESYLAQDLADSGFAALSIDFRGTGGSLGERDLESFSQEDLAGIQLDVRAALEFLSSQAMVDADRIGIVAASWSADYAVLEAAENPQIQALVLISGTLGENAKKYLQSDHSIPVLGVVGKDDKESFWRMAQVYAASPRHSSDLLLAVGYGAGMFSHTKGLEGKVVQWLDHNLKALGAETEVSFRSEDGWTLHGRLRIPGGMNGSTKVPGVVMIHGARHDQQTYYGLAQELAKQGMATLRFDWRGKGRSINAGKGRYGVDLSNEETGKTYLDVIAAIEFFALQAGVDASRIGLIAATAGTGHALQAAYGDGRIQTVVLLTSARAPEGEAKQFLTTSGKPIFAIASTEDINYNRGSLAEETRQTYLFSNNKESEFLLYDDAGRGSEMLKSKPELERMIVRWFAEKLSAGRPANGGLEFSQDRR
ncbi:MAG: alpha/beta hydrolase [Acidobacteria bacterium]|nr:alpha/beta hydrolase [Acidobacteriota bacterium]